MSRLSLVVALVALSMASLLALVLAQPGMPEKPQKEHICAACKAAIKELIKMVGPVKKRTESKVIEGLDGVCEFEKFRIYDFPPPTMLKACQVFMGDHEDAMERELLKQGDKSTDELVDHVCNKVTKVCKGVNLDNANKDTKVYMDGKPMGAGGEL